MEDTTKASDNTGKHPDRVFLGPLLDNVLKTGTEEVKALLAYYTLFFDRFYFSDAPLLNHPTFYNLYNDKNGRGYLEEWLSTGLMVPCLRKDEGINSFKDLLEYQDQDNVKMAGRITDSKFVTSRKDALSYACFLDKCSNPQRFSLTDTSATFTRTIEKGLENEEFLRKAGLHEATELIREYVQFVKCQGRGLTISRTNLYHLTRPRDYKDTDLDKDVVPFVAKYSDKYTSVDRLAEQMQQYVSPLRAWSDAVYNGNLPYNTLHSTLAMPWGIGRLFTSIWAPPTQPDETTTKVLDIGQIPIDSTLLLAKKGYAKLGASDLQRLRQETPWAEYRQALSSDSCNYNSTRDYVQSLSEVLPALLLEKDRSFTIPDALATMAVKVREFSKTWAWEITLSLLSRFLKLPDLPPLPPQDTRGIQDLWVFSVSFAGEKARDKAMQRSEEVRETVYGDCHLAQSAISHLAPSAS